MQYLYLSHFFGLSHPKSHITAKIKFSRVYRLLHMCHTHFSNVKFCLFVLNLIFIMLILIMNLMGVQVPPILKRDMRWMAAGAPLYEISFRGLQKPSHSGPTLHKTRVLTSPVRTLKIRPILRAGNFLQKNTRQASYFIISILIYSLKFSSSKTASLYTLVGSTTVCSSI